MNKMIKLFSLLLVLFFVADCGWLNRYKKPGRRKHHMHKHGMNIEHKKDTVVSFNQFQ